MADNPPAARPGSTAPPLDDVMLAMDVVDTLRHADRLVERELGAEQREADLKNRLREIYRSQGIEVRDEVLSEGVAALREERFVYHPAVPGVSRSLALAWVNRGRWGRPLLGGVAAIVFALAAWWLVWVLPEQHRLEAEKTELASGLPKRYSTELDRIRAVALDPVAIGDAERLKREGDAAARAGDVVSARRSAEQLGQLREALEQSYTIRVVSSPGQRSGAYRIPRANPNARNYYLIVEAIGTDGKAMPLRISSEEDGRSERVTQWGLRVSQSAYEQIRLDKQDDGIIQANRVGEKRKGYLKPDYVIPSVGGAILDW